jgi:hypothetical protein
MKAELTQNAVFDKLQMERKGLATEPHTEQALMSR